MTAWSYEISLLVLKYFTCSLRSLVKSSSVLEDKFRSSTRPCNIVYIQYMDAITLSLFSYHLKKGLRSHQNGDREELAIITSLFLQKVENTVAQNRGSITDGFCL